MSSVHDLQPHGLGAGGDGVGGVGEGGVGVGPGGVGVGPGGASSSTTSASSSDGLGPPPLDVQIPDIQTPKGTELQGASSCSGVGSEH
jgi:hypothetical protein